MKELQVGAASKGKVLILLYKFCIGGYALETLDKLGKLNNKVENAVSPFGSKVE